MHCSIGRPCIDVCKEELLRLKELNYSWTKIARMIGVSRSTLYRKLRDFDIDSSDSYSDIAPSDLDDLLKEIKVEQPDIGEVILQGRLLHMGIKVTRSQLRSSIHRIDHSNTVARRSRVINRRVYSVPHPNAVWHIDGNHKMIRWRLVVHAGVDGFTRLIVFIKCSNNNCSTTVLDAFREGETAYGTPDCVRSDHGGENVLVWRHMLERHDNTSSVITGRSTHNVRVERMWRDITRCASSTFIRLFSALEADGVLDPLNELDIFCLHFVFLPRINKSLQDFQGSWNCHRLSSEGNMSPMQLFMEGQSARRQLIHTTESDAISSVLPSNLTTVETPSNKFEPCSQLVAGLNTTIDPLAHCADLGRQLYQDCVELVGQHLRNGCNYCKNDA